MDLDRTRTWDLAPLARTITWDQPPLSGASTFPQCGQPVYPASTASFGPWGTSPGSSAAAVVAPVPAPVPKPVSQQLQFKAQPTAASIPIPQFRPVPPVPVQCGPTAIQPQARPQPPSISAPSQVRAASRPAAVQYVLPTSGPGQQAAADTLVRSTTWSRAPSVPLGGASSNPADWTIPAAPIQHVAATSKASSSAPNAVLAPAPLLRTRTGGLASMPEDTTVSFASTAGAVSSSSPVTVAAPSVEQGSVAKDAFVSARASLLGAPLPGSLATSPDKRAVRIVRVQATSTPCAKVDGDWPPALQRSVTTSAGAVPQLGRAISTGVTPLLKTYTVDLGTVAASRQVQGSRAKSQRPLAVRQRLGSEAVPGQPHDRSDSVPPVARRVPSEAQPSRPLTTSPPRRVFPTIPAPPTKVSAHIPPNGSIAGKLTELPQLAKQLRIVVAGLMGSGKSTLCRMLRHLLGGQWVNQDEFADKKKGAKKAFLAEIERVANDKSIPVLLVDKINTMRQHRREIRESMERGGPGDIVLIQLRHPADAAGRWDHAIQLCEERIQSRGTAHRTLKGNEPKLRSILEMTAKGAEEMAEDEMGWFKAQIEANMTLDPVPVAMEVLSRLDDCNLLTGFDIDELLNERTVMDALEVAKQAEAALESQDSKGNQKSAAPRQVWLWELALEEEACARVRQLWDEAIDGRALEPIPRPHVTLLYIGGGTDREIAARHAGFGGDDEVAKFRSDLENKAGMEVAFEVTSVVWDNRVAAAEVSGLQALSANAHPHITLATAPKVPPVVSNELLARRAASADLDTGLGQWLKELSLEQYQEPLRSWCLAMGAASPDEISENAADAAAAMEPQNTDERSRIQALLERCKPGELSSVELNPPIVVTGRVHAQRR